MKISTVVKLLFSMVCFLIFFDQSAHAQGELLFGQNHYYTVVFRGNGEAVTYARIVVSNPTNTPLTNFSFEVPKVTPSEMSVLQVKLPQTCTDYNYSDPQRPCLQYKDPDYNSYYYGYGVGSPEYQKVDTVKTGNLYSFNLPFPVEPYKSTAIIVSYAAKGYVKNFLQLYSFNFETLKVPSRIKKVQVAVEVDSDLLLKGKTSSVNYALSGGELTAMSMSGSSFSNQNLTDLVTRIGVYGSLIKQAQDLSPNESFTVRGEYSTSWLRLYANSIIVTLLIVATILGTLFFWPRIFNKLSSRIPPVESTNGANVLYHSVATFKTGVSATFATCATSLVSVIGTVGFTYFLKYFYENILIKYVGNEMILWVIILICALLVYILILLIPAIIMGSRYGWKAFAGVLLYDVFWFLIIIIIYINLFQGNQTNSSGYGYGRMVEF